MCKSHLQKQKLISIVNIILDVDTVIKVLDQEGTYRYLIVKESNRIQHSMMKETFRTGVHHPN